MTQFLPGQIVTLNDERLGLLKRHLSPALLRDVETMLQAVAGYAPLYYVGEFTATHAIVSRDPDPAKALPDVATIVPLDLLVAVQ